MVKFHKVSLEESFSCRKVFFHVVSRLRLVFRQLEIDFRNHDAAYRFSGAVTVFHERTLPEKAMPVGYAALIDTFDLRVPLPRLLTAVGERHRVRTEGGWRIFTPRHAPSADLEGHLTFALKYEGLAAVETD